MRARRIYADQRWTYALIVAFSALLVLLTWTAVIEQTRYERKEAIAAAVRQNENRAIAFEQYVTRTLEAADVAMLHLSDKQESISGTADDPRWLQDPVLDNALFGVVSIANARGDVVATTASPPPRNMNAAPRDGFAVHVARDSGRLFIGTAREVRTVGRVLMGLSRRINGPGGGFAGVVSIQMDPDKFTDFSEQANVRATDIVSVVGLDGITRARRTGGRSSYGEDLRGMRVMAEQARNPNGTYLGPGALDGIVRYFSHRRLRDYPLFVTVGVARDEILAPINARGEKYYLGAALVTLGTFAFAWVMIAGFRRRQRAAIEVARTNERLREAQRVGQIGDWEYDFRTGEIIWSEQMFAMYRRDPALGPPSLADVLSYCDEPSRLAIERAVESAAETGETQAYELRVPLPGDGAEYHQTFAIPTRDASGKVVRLHGTDQDVTDRKTLEALQAKLAHGSRIDAMNTMAATLAHELNQPLTAATNYLAGSKRTIGRAGATESARLHEGIEGAERQIRLAANIIRRIRDMVSDRSGGFERAPLPEIIHDALSLVAMANNYPGISVTQNLCGDARFVTADRVQIQQVLINLVRNACDALAGRKRPEIVISAQRDDAGDIEVCVADNGPGLVASPEELFSPFATSKPTGLGLGLPISRTIVEAHGGRIWVDADSERGTRICFTISAGTSQSNAEAQASSISDAAVAA